MKEISVSKKRQLKTTSDISNRLVRNIIDIHNESTSPTDILFQHSILSQCYLPYSRPIVRDGRKAVKDENGKSLEKTEWEVSNGNATLMINSGRLFDPKTKKFGSHVGIPYGAKARLIFICLNQQALINQSPVIHVGHSMTEFLETCGIHTDGKSIKWGKEQLQRISASTMQIGWVSDNRPKQANLNIVEVFEPWFPEDSSQKVLWDSQLTLSNLYYESLCAHAIPLNGKAVMALSHSAMAMDIYVWMTQRLHRIKGYQFFTWKLLQSQFGTEYNRLSDFRRDFKAALLQVRGLYQDAKFEVMGTSGIRFYHSKPAISQRVYLAKK